MKTSAYQGNVTGVQYGCCAGQQFIVGPVLPVESRNSAGGIQTDGRVLISSSMASPRASRKKAYRRWPTIRRAYPCMDEDVRSGRWVVFRKQERAAVLPGGSPPIGQR